MDQAQRRRLIIVATAAAGVLAFSAAGVVVLHTASGGSSGPAMGEHRHAPYEVVVCGEPQPPIAEFAHTSGVHTHGDGIMHLHPLTAEGEGAGASVGRFFKNSGGWFDSFFAPSGCITEHGDPLVLRADSGIHPLGASFAEASALCNSIAQSEFDRVSPDYVPEDGDCIRIIFIPQE